MQFHFAFKHMDTSPALQAYAEEKLLDRIEKFVTKPIAATVTFSVLKNLYTVHCHLEAGDGFSIDVEQTCDDMHTSMDVVADKLTTQLRKHKEKLKDHKAPRRVIPLIDPEAHAAEAVDAADILKYEQGRRRAGAR